MQQQALEIDTAEHAGSGGPSPVASVLSSIRMLDRHAWNICFSKEIETYDYLLVVEEAGIAGFDFRYVVLREDDEIVAAMPAFLCRYALETTLQPGRIRRSVGRIRCLFPEFLTLRLACLGSPCTETGMIGFHPRISESRRPQLFAQLLAAFEAHAQAEGCSLIAMKDLALPLPLGVTRVLSDGGYAEIASMPTAFLDIDFDTLDDYLSRLSAGTRKDMRRKLRGRGTVRVEYRSDFGEWLPRVMQLYLETRERSEWQFEELTPAYFQGLLKGMPGRSFCTMYFVEDELLAANVMVCDGSRLIDKFFCMDAPRGRAHNLYYLSWFTNLEYCLRHRIGRYQSGQAYYRNKVRLGSSLTANAMYFRHRNAVLQLVLKTVSPFFSGDDGAEVMT